MTDTFLLIVVAVPVARDLVRYWLHLRFLRHVFARNGDRADLWVAGAVARNPPTSPGRP